MTNDPRKRRIVILAAALCGAVFSYLRQRSGAPAFFGLAAIDPALRAHWPWFVAGIVVWGVFGVYWEVAAANSAPAKSAESTASRGVHVFLVNVAQLLELVPITGIGRYLPASPFIMAAGVAVEAMGALLAVWARQHLGRNWSGAIAIKIEHRLIRTGPYRFLRHPIYTGLLAMYAGLAIVTGERLALIGLAIAAVAYWRKIRLEEAALDSAFGSDYDAYRRETWALVPGVF